MLIGVDGTGPGDDAEYRRDMTGSFVHRMIDDCPEAYKEYVRGPTLLGLETEPIALSVIGLIRQRLRDSPDDRRLFLAGYSRGGAVCVRVAQLLRVAPAPLAGLTCACMALFDAVDREPVSDTSVIPGNVSRVYHARQSYTLSRSRWYFYNWGIMADCGSSVESPGRFRMEHFYATHAAMGGVPWTGDHPTRRVFHPPGIDWGVDHNLQPYIRPYGPEWADEPLITEPEDRAESHRVRQWMWDHVRRHGMVR
jgi:hypothetical protein